MGDLITFLKNALSTWLVQLILKVGGAWFATVGIQEASVTNVVLGVVAFLFGLLGQKLQVNTALETPPPTKPAPPDPR